MAPPKQQGGDAPAKLSSTLLSLPFMQRGRQQQPPAESTASAPAAATQQSQSSSAAASSNPPEGKAQLSDRLQGMKFMQRAAQKRKAADAFGEDEEAARKREAEVRLLCAWWPRAVCIGRGSEVLGKEINLGFDGRWFALPLVDA